MKTLMLIWVLFAVACGSDEKVAPVEDSGSDVSGFDAGNDASEDLQAPFCGDGVLDPEEACDDGNQDDEDGCSSACEFEEMIIRNLEFTRNARDDCFNGICTTDYNLTFTLQNFSELPSVEIREAKLTFEASVGTAEFFYAPCKTHALGPMSISEIERWEFVFNRVDGHFLHHEGCTGRKTVPAETPWDDGSITLELSGLYDDGAVWRTRATSVMRNLE